jgi:hypothetical protein
MVSIRRVKDVRAVETKILGFAGGYTVCKNNVVFV